MGSTLVWLAFLGAHELAGSRQSCPSLGRNGYNLWTLPLYGLLSHFNPNYIGSRPENMRESAESSSRSLGNRAVRYRQIIGSLAPGPSGGLEIAGGRSCAGLRRRGGDGAQQLAFWDLNCPSVCWWQTLSCPRAAEQGYDISDSFGCSTAAQILAFPYSPLQHPNSFLHTPPARAARLQPAHETR